MNKIYSFIALFLMCFVGSVQAQVHQWSPVDGEEVSVDEIEDGAFYVLRGADNTYAETGEPGKDAGHTANYLSFGQKPNVITHECVYQFEITNLKDSEDNIVYILKNVSSGQYLANGGGYTDSKTKAFRFTALKGELKAESDYSDRVDYVNAMSETRSINAADLGAWVLCDMNGRNYMCYYGNPAFAGYMDTNNWLIIKVQEDKMSEYSKLSAVFDKYLSEGVDPSIYPVGINPGCVSQDFYNRLEDVCQQAIAVLNKVEQATDEECIAAREAIEKIFEDIKTEMVPVGVGYYVIQNERGGFLKDNEKGYCDKNLTYPVASWNLKNTIYIWKVEEAEDVEGGILLKNYSTNRYIGPAGEYKMVDENGGVFKTERLRDTTFYVTQNGNGVNIGHNGFMTNWNDKNDAGNHFFFYKVDQLAIDSLDEKIEQNLRNSKLADLVEQAEKDLKGLKYKNGFVADGFYNHPNDSGLVTEVLATYAADNGKTGEELFDGDRSTFYHTAWRSGSIENVVEGSAHWINLDLGKDVQKLIVKFSKRQGAANGHINRYDLYSSANGTVEETWTKIASSKDSIMYQFSDSTTHIAEYTFDAPVRYLRFAVTSTRGKHVSEFDKMTDGTGPFWHCSELRFYDAAECIENPNFILIPEATRNALNDAITAAKAELEEKAATEKAYETLEEALEKFWDAYPDATGLRNQLDEAKEIAAGAVEGETGNEIGFFQKGAKDAYLAEIEKIVKVLDDAEAAGQALTLVQIEEQEANLEAATKAFNAKLNVPEGGKVYRLVSTAPANENGEDRPQTDAVVISRDADYLNGTPGWAYKNGDSDIDTRFNALWYVEKTDAGFSFKNLANGLYMNNAYDGLTKDSVENAEIPGAVGYSKTPKYYNLESYIAEDHEAGSFLLAMGFGEFLNMQPTGLMVHWSDRTDAHSPFTFVPVDVENEFDGTYQVDIQSTGKPQILSLPIALSEVMSTSAYEVLGLNQDKIILSEITGEIAAGTPFIIIPESSDDTYIETSLEGSSLDDFLGMKYEYKPIIVKGLVSAPVSFETTKEQAYGVLTDGVVYASVGGDHIAAGSGYFNNELPKVEDESEYFLPVDGVISGEGTGIENAVIVKNVASDVYTISGVKVRNNVKAANATKGLPKGIYIVAGKKVVVK